MNLYFMSYISNLNAWRSDLDATGVYAYLPRLQHLPQEVTPKIGLH